MADVREQILSRLAAILATIPATIDGAPGVFKVIARNRSELTADQRPALLLLDGDEKVGDQFTGTQRPSNAPRSVVMSPQIAIVLGGREPKNENIGQDLNAIRAAIIKAVAQDAELHAILGKPGAAQYGGLVSDLNWGMPMEGIHALQFVITYTLQITQL